MKKFVLFLFALLLMFSLTACCCLEIPSNDAEFTTGVIESEYIVVEPSTDETESNYDIAEPSTDETESDKDTVEPPTTSKVESTPSAVEPAIKVFDYSALCGTYYNSIPVNENGPSYFVTIDKIDNNTKNIAFTINYVGYNCSPLYETNTIYATIASDNTVHFTWTDSWMNKGTGTLVLNPTNTSTIQILVTVTEDSGANRATLSTNGNYKTLTRG